MSVIHLPKRKVLRPPSTSAAIPKNTITPKDGPSIETTVMEAVAIRKWLHFALEDIHFQLEEISKDKTVSRRSFNESKQTAMVISSYLIAVLGDLEERLTTQPPSGAA